METRKEGNVSQLRQIWQEVNRERYVHLRFTEPECTSEIFCSFGRHSGDG